MSIRPSTISRYVWRQICHDQPCSFSRFCGLLGPRLIDSTCSILGPPPCISSLLLLSLCSWAGANCLGAVSSQRHLCVYASGIDEWLVFGLIYWPWEKSSNQSFSDSPWCSITGSFGMSIYRSADLTHDNQLRSIPDEFTHEMLYLAWITCLKDACCITNVPCNAINFIIMPVVGEIERL